MRSQGLEEGTRGSALWGRGSKRERRRGAVARGLFVVATLLLALLVGVGTSFAARTAPPAKPGSTAPGPNYTSTATYPDGSLFARAQANPRQLFKVIIQSNTWQAQALIQQWSGPRGQFQRSFRLLRSVSTTLPGWAILYLNEHAAAFGGLSITEDAPVTLVDPQAASTGSSGPAGQSGPSDWQRSIGATELWSHPAVSCDRDSAGALLDPTCLPLDAYTAPPAPAIAVIDSGIDSSKVADFGGRVVARVNFAGDNPSLDPLGHGTMLAGIAAGAFNRVSGGGVAQNAPLIDVRVANARGAARTSDILAALDWVVQNKAQYNIRVVNMSLAGTRRTSFAFDPIDQAVEKLWINGIVVVAAAGNDGVNGPTQDLGAPGNDPFVITVGAVDTNGTTTQGDDFRAPWSAYGHTPDGFLKPEISAPGRYIVGPVPARAVMPLVKPTRVVSAGYMWMSGTSFATAVVSGTAAQLLALNPDWTPDQLKGALMAGAVKLGSDGVGIGEVNLPASAAVNSPPNPNEGVDAFVQTDPESGLRTFDARGWFAAVRANSAWTSSAWTSSAWTSSAWTSNAWTSSAWTSSAWTSNAWTSSAWTSNAWTSNAWTSSVWVE